MRTTSQLFIAVIAFLALATSVYAQSPREQLNQMVQQLQKEPNDNALREKIIKLGMTIKPAPVIPEEARRSFIIGETLFKQAKNIRSAYEAANAFWKATTLAPLWSNAYWNLAVAEQLAGQYVTAKETLRLYLLTNPSAADRRLAQDRLYAIDADIIAARSSVPGGLAGFWQKVGQQYNGAWKETYQDDARHNQALEIQQTGSTYNIKCIDCGEDWKVSVISATIDSINFQMLLDSKYSKPSPLNNECKLNGGELYCTVTDQEEKGSDLILRFAKRSVCEIVGGLGLIGYPVLCK